MTPRLRPSLVQLKRRKVYHVGAAYVVAGSPIVEGAHPLLMVLLSLDILAAQIIAVITALGFPVALVSAWACEVRPESEGSGSLECPGFPIC